MHLIIKIMTFLFFVAELKAAPIPSSWRFQLDFGYETFDYKDEYQFQPFLNNNIKSKNLTTRLQGTYFLWAPYLYLEGAGDYSKSQSSNHDVAFYKYEIHARVGFYVPGDYFWFKLISENYFTSLVATDNSYGYKNIESWVVYPVFGLNSQAIDSAINLSIYYKFPILKASNQIKETLIGAEVRIPLGEKFKYPLFAYQKAIFFRLEYRDYEFEYLISSRSLIIKNESLLYSIGYNF
jgi:hypothetical protein